MPAVLPCVQVPRAASTRQETQPHRRLQQAPTAGMAIRPSVRLALRSSCGMQRWPPISGVKTSSTVSCLEAGKYLEGARGRRTAMLFETNACKAIWAMSQHSGRIACIRELGTCTGIATRHVSDKLVARPAACQLVCCITNCVALQTA